MSFSAKVKEELIEKEAVCKRCATFELAAILDENIIKNEDFCLITCENKTIYEVLKKLFTRIFKNTENEYDEVKNLFEKDYIKKIEIANPVIMEKVDSIILSKEKVLLKDTKSCCKKAFLRGEFIKKGSVSAPEGLYHFEISFENIKSAELVRKIFKEFDIDTRIIERKGHYVIYIKEGAHISDVLNIIGATEAQLEFVEAMVVKDVRNGINRRVNCETANLKKTISAAVVQIKNIEKIKRVAGLDILDVKLKQTAELRLKYPDASLSAIGEMTTPAVSRSGVNNRFKAIAKIAESL